MPRAFDRGSGIAFVIYAGLSVFFFGRNLIGRFGAVHVGEGPDPDLMMWFLVWWPHAIMSGTNPIVTHAFWAPAGLNLTWSTSVPLLSLIAAPLTWLAGPIATLNTLCLLGAALTAWAAFVLCRRLCNSYWPAVLGGYIFGFCPMLLGQMLFGRLHLIWLFSVPLAIYAAALRLDEDITRRRFCVLLTLLLIVQFLCSVEVFATFVLFGCLAIALAWIRADRQIRLKLTDLAVNVTVSLAVVAVVVSPYLFYFFADPPYSGTVWSPHALAADSLNLLVPTQLNLLGRLRVFDSLAARFNGGIASESTAYLSYPLITIAMAFGHRYRRTVLGRVLRDVLVIAVIFSLGRSLVIQGMVAERLALPWRALQVSVYRNVATVRLTMYAYLVLAMMASMWLAASNSTTRMKLATAAVIVICMLPNLSAAHWVSRPTEPAFFRDGLYRQHLSREQTVLILPFWPRNDAMRWQSQSHMYFRLAQGCGPWPDAVKEWPILDAFMRATYIPRVGQQLKAYVLNHGVDTVIVEDSQLSTWAGALKHLDVAPINVGGVSLFHVRRSTEENPPTLARMRELYDFERFETVLHAAQTYLATGGDRAKLTAATLFELGLIDADAVVGPPAPPEISHPEINWSPGRESRYGVSVTVNKSNLVTIEEATSRETGERLSSLYGGFAHSAEFVVSRDSNDKSRERMGTLVMVFDDQQLANASSEAKRAGLAGRR